MGFESFEDLDERVKRIFEAVAERDRSLNDTSFQSFLVASDFELPEKKEEDFDLEVNGILGEGTFFKVYSVRAGERNYAVGLTHEQFGHSKFTYLDLDSTRRLFGLAKYYVLVGNKYGCYSGFICENYPNYQTLKSRIDDLHYKEKELTKTRRIFKQLFKKHKKRSEELEAECIELRKQNIEVSFRVYRNLLDFVLSGKRERKVHRDIKPENILVNGDGSDSIVIDIGTLTNQYTKKPNDYSIGTCIYMPPEMFNDGLINYKMDLFSSTLVLYYGLRLHGLAPFLKPFATTKTYVIRAHFLNKSHLPKTTANPDLLVLPRDIREPFVDIAKYGSHPIASDRDLDTVLEIMDEHILPYFDKTKTE